jgi:hypothetical protein
MPSLFGLNNGLGELLNSINTSTGHQPDQSLSAPLHPAILQPHHHLA